MERLWKEAHITGKMEESEEKGPTKEGVKNIYYE